MSRKQNTEKELVVSTGAAAAPARRKPAANSRKKREVTPAEPVASLSAPVDGVLTDVTVSVIDVESTFAEPTYEQIASLAYALWEARGCQGGSPEDDWFEAEQQLRARN
jgi:hypothetical protein